MMRAKDMVSWQTQTGDSVAVRVDPVLDVTKIGLAFFTALGAMFIMLGKMRRAARE